MAGEGRCPWPRIPTPSALARPCGDVIAALDVRKGKACGVQWPSDCSGEQARGQLAREMTINESRAGTLGDSHGSLAVAQGWACQRFTAAGLALRLHLGPQEMCKPLSDPGEEAVESASLPPQDHQPPGTPDSWLVPRGSKRKHTRLSPGLWA